MARWKPEYDELYWYISQLDLIKSWYWLEEDIDHEFYEIGNVFQTYEQAKQALEKVKETLLNYQMEISNNG
jgi:hypothetical protein